MIEYYSPNIDLILVGCGFLGGYHMGALCLLRQIWPKKYYQRITGASCGGILGSIVASGVDLLQTFQAAISIIREARNIISNLARFRYRSIKNLLRDRLEKLLPENCHKLCSSQFGLTLTNPWTFECILVTEFESRRDLIDAVLAGSFIPIWSGSMTLPKFRGEPYVDGGFVNNRPRFEYGQEELESGRVSLAICPFATDSEVCPKLTDYFCTYHTVGLTYKISWGAVKKGIHALLPFRTSVYKTYFIHGHRDMKQYILDNDMIKCESCYKLNAIGSQKLPDKLNSLEQKDEKASGKACIMCLRLKEQVDALEPPESFIKVMDD